MRNLTIIVAMAGSVLAGCGKERDFSPTTDLKPLEDTRIGKAQGRDVKTVIGGSAAEGASASAAAPASGGSAAGSPAGSNNAGGGSITGSAGSSPPAGTASGATGGQGPAVHAPTGASPH